MQKKNIKVGEKYALRVNVSRRTTQNYNSLPTKVVDDGYAIVEAIVTSVPPNGRGVYVDYSLPHYRNRDPALVLVNRLVDCRSVIEHWHTHQAVLDIEQSRKNRRRLQVEVEWEKERIALQELDSLVKVLADLLSQQGIRAIPSGVKASRTTNERFFTDLHFDARGLHQLQRYILRNTIPTEDTDNDSALHQQ